MRARKMRATMTAVVTEVISHPPRRGQTLPQEAGMAEMAGIHQATMKMALARARRMMTPRWRTRRESP
jgi:hypothetical protein